MKSSITGNRNHQVFGRPHDLQLVDIWKFLLRHSIWIASGAALGLVVAFLANARSPRLYTSMVTVEMNKDASSGLGLQDLSGAGSALGIGSDFMTDMLTQQAVLLSDSTALSVIDRLNLLSVTPYAQMLKPKGATTAMPATMASLNQSATLRDQVLGKFRTKLRVAPVKNTRLMTVSCTDPDPVEAAQVANAVVEAYLTNHTRTRYEATTKASSWLNEQLTGLKRQAEDVHRQVAAMERDSGILNTSSGIPDRNGEAPSGSRMSTPEYEQLLIISQALSKAQLDHIQEEAIYRLTLTSDPDALLDENGTKIAMANGTPLAATNSSMQLIQSLRSQSASLKLRLAAEKVTYAQKNPVMIELQNQLDSINMQLMEEMGRVRGEAKRNLDLAKAKEDAIRKTFDKQQQRVSSIGNRVEELAFLREQENTGRRLYQDLYTRLEEANIAAGVRSSGMSVVDPARPPSRVSSPVLQNDLVAGLAGGLLFGILGGLVRQVTDRKLNIPDEFEENSSAPLLGVIPGFDRNTERSGYAEKVPSTRPNAIADQAWILRSPKSHVAEAYRQVRTSILLSSVDRPPQVILFTSPVIGEGKSTTAYNLAAAFAAQSSKVLLLDADMRRPSVAKLAGYTDRRGLSEVLSGRSTFDELVHNNVNLPTLQLLLSGTLPPDPAELLGSQRFANLIQDLRKRYDYILIDAPPVLLVTDPVIASTLADGVVCVLRAGETERPSLRRFWAILSQPSINILGFVVNDFNRRLQSYGYGYEGYRSASYYDDRTV